MNAIPKEADLHVGLDYERARARLNQDAGLAFRQYLALKNNPTATSQSIEAARVAYIEANSTCRDLRRHDHDAIAAVLGGAR